jgi:hypothetical protein
MPRKQLNSYQLELRSPENKARVQKIAETNQRIFKLAEQSDRERRRLCRLALEQKLARRSHESISQEPTKFPERRISYLEGLFLGIFIGVSISLFLDLTITGQHSTLAKLY